MNKNYQIGKVCELTGLTHATLRFWEKHFPFLTPARSSGGHRYYNGEQLQVIETLKQLLHVEGYTIEGAKKKLAQDASEQADILQTVKDGLIEIKNLLK